MAVMMGNLYSALKQAGADEENARKAAEEIAGYREDWESGSARFGQVEGYGGQVQRLPAPPLPGVRLKARMAPPAPEDPSAWG